MSATDEIRASQEATRDAPYVPLDNVVPPVPPFPVDVLPPKLRDWVEAISHEKQTPPDLAALMGLTTASTAALGRVQIMCKPGWIEEIGLYGVSGLPTGERKSAVVREAVRPLRELEAGYMELYAVETISAGVERELLDAERTKIKRRFASGKQEDGDMDRLSEIAQEIERIDSTVEPRLLADDATPEAIAGLLSRHARIGIIADESAFIDNLRGRYSDGKANLHLVCQAYSGEQSWVDRRGRPAELLKNPLLAIGLPVQPHVIDAAVGDGTMRVQGFLARTLFSIPKTALGERRFATTPVSDSIRNAYSAAIRRIAGLKIRDEVNPGLVLEFAPDAAITFQAFCESHEPRLHPEKGDLAVITGWAHRLPGQVARLAANLHLLIDVTNPQISTRTLLAAIDLGDYFLEHARTVLDIPAGEGLHRAIRWLLKHDVASAVTRRDVHRGPLGARSTVEEAERLVRQLVGLGYLEEIRVEPSGQRGRPGSPVYGVTTKGRTGAGDED